MMGKENREYTESELMHIREQLDWVRSIVRQCSRDRMPQGACPFCLQIYRTAVNAALDAGVWDEAGV